MQFTYRAKQGPQKIIEGVVDADNMDSAVAKVMQLGYTPLDIRGKSAQALPLVMAFKSPFSWAKKVPLPEVAIFTQQVSGLISAGVPLLRALAITQKQTRHPYLKDIVAEMCASVKDGGMFSAALGRYPQVFSRLYVNMVKSGEMAGNMDVVLSRLAQFLEQEEEVRSQVTSSLLYPAFVLVVGTGAVFFLMTWMIPRITVIFEDFGEALPLPTVILLTISGILTKFWWLLPLVAGSVYFYWRKLQGTPAGKLWLDGLKLKLPLLGNFLRDTEIGRFARTLGTLLDSGVAIVSALESVSLVIENELIREEINKIAQKVANGVSLTNAVKDSPLFPEAAVNMIAIGEESGETHDGLYKLAVYYERQTQRLMKGALSLLGPILILVIGLIVFFVVLAMLMPILRMNMIIK